MISVQELLKNIPSAKMDEQEQYISIPIKEYENYRNIASLQDKQSIIRDLQNLLVIREEDLRRYKEKCEQSQVVLQRTQKALDKRIQSEQNPNLYMLPKQSNRLPGAIQLRRSDSKPKPPAIDTAEPQLVSRAIGDNEPTTHGVGKLTTASLPDPNLRASLSEDTLPGNIKSLPLNLGMGSPGMSTALLRRLVQENLKLKTLLDKKNPSKTIKISDSETQISELKDKIKRQEQEISDLRNRPGEGKDADIITVRLTELHKQNEAHLKTIAMNQIVIGSLKLENEKLSKEKDGIEGILHQYRQYKKSAEETNERISELEEKLQDESEYHRSSEAKIESLKMEVEKLQKKLESVEIEKDLAVQNYNTLCSQYNQMGERPSSATPLYQSHRPPQMTGGPLMMQQPSVATTFGRQSHEPSFQSRTDSGYEPHSLQVRSPSHLAPRSGSPYSHTGPQSNYQTSSDSVNRMSQSVYVSPGNYSGSAGRPAGPLPQERKTFKCPRCEAVFNALQGYRDHIKMCLKA